MSLRYLVKCREWSKVLAQIVAEPYRLYELYSHGNGICYYIAKRNPALLISIVDALNDTKHDTLLFALNRFNEQRIAPLTVKGKISHDMHRYFSDRNLVRKDIAYNKLFDPIHERFMKLKIRDAEELIRETIFPSRELTELFLKDILVWSIQYKCPTLTNFIFLLDLPEAHDILAKDSISIFRLSSMIYGQELDFYYQCARLEPSLYDKFQQHYVKFCHGTKEAFLKKFQEEELRLFDIIVPQHERQNNLLSIVLHILERS